MNTLSLSFALLAGLLTTLSPCVLPVLPFVTASSMGKSRWGPVALAVGLLITFVGVTLLISQSGAILGIEPTWIRRGAGVLLALSGLLFLSDKAAERFAELFSGFSGKANSAIGENRLPPLLSEFVSGILLGIVWTPCSGPSLGAALSLAAQAESPAEASLTLFVFGLGAVVPLMAIAYGAKGLMVKMRSRASTIGKIKKIFGVLMIVFGILIVTDLDRHLEATLTMALPDSWIEFITKF